MVSGPLSGGRDCGIWQVQRQSLWDSSTDPAGSEKCLREAVMHLPCLPVYSPCHFSDHAGLVDESHKTEISTNEGVE